MKPIALARVEPTWSIATQSDGDLWPCAWSDDDCLYTANGDGKGFDLLSEWCDIVVNRIEGDLGHLHGVRLSGAAGVGSVYVDETRYNRKPTGMLSMGGTLYLAVQSLNKTNGVGGFDEVPCASVLCSRDKGYTWSWDEAQPMFFDHQFTTIMFLDYGKDSQHCPDGFAYAYGMDYNWRASFSNAVPDPTALYLARVKPEDMLNREAWAFYAGIEASGAPRFSSRMTDRVPVLTDERRIAVTPPADKGESSMMSVISQGSVVYNAPLNRYIYSSWTENTFEFYEAPTPYGPFRLFLSHDFGFYPWNEQRYGGYATVIPSKFISGDGKTMYVVSCTFVGNVNKYSFGLRKLTVEV